MIGIDAPIAASLALAARRLGRRATLQTANFVRAALPRADAVVASIALHHVRTRSAKTRLYRADSRGAQSCGRVHQRRLSSGRRTRRAARAQRDAWMVHLRESSQHPQSRSAAARHGVQEDVYVSLDAELALLAERRLLSWTSAWRRGMFAVIVAGRR